MVSRSLIDGVPNKIGQSQLVGGSDGWLAFWFAPPINAPILIDWKWCLPVRNEGLWQLNLEKVGARWSTQRKASMAALAQSSLSPLLVRYRVP